MTLNPRRMLGVLLLGMMAVVAVACGGSGQQSTPTPTPASASNGGQEPTGFAAEWQALIEAAQAEGELVAVLGSSQTRNYGRIFDEFERRFNIRTIRTEGSGSDNANRVLAERSAGRYTSDISMIGSSSVIRLIDAGAILPIMDVIIHPDVLDESAWFGGRIWFNDLQQKYIFAYQGTLEPNVNPVYYNKDRVSQEEVDAITSYWDFVGSDWTFGAILPNAGGSTTERFRYYAHPDLGPEWLRRHILESDITFVGTDRRSLVDGLAGGRWHWSIMPSSAGAVDLDTAISDGLPIGRIDRTLKEGKVLSIGGTLAAIDRAPHPNAAKLFINWFLSREGQTVRHELNDDPNPVQSLRLDVEPIRIPPENQRREGEEYFVLDTGPESVKAREQDSLEFMDTLLREAGVGL